MTTPFGFTNTLSLSSGWIAMTDSPENPSVTSYPALLVRPTSFATTVTIVGLPRLLSWRNAMTKLPLGRIGLDQTSTCELLICRIKRYTYWNYIEIVHLNGHHRVFWRLFLFDQTRDRDTYHMSRQGYITHVKTGIHNTCQNHRTLIIVAKYWEWYVSIRLRHGATLNNNNTDTN